MGPLFKNKKNMEANTDPFHFITVTELMLGLAAPKSWMGTERRWKKSRMVQFILDNHLTGSWVYGFRFEWKGQAGLWDLREILVYSKRCADRERVRSVLYILRTYSMIQPQNVNKEA